MHAKHLAITLAKVAASIVVIALIQKNFMNVPVVGEYLPGFTAR